MNPDFRSQLQDTLGVNDFRETSLPGGDAASAWRLETDAGNSYFVKSVAQGSPFNMEALGLRLLSSPTGIRVPEVIAFEPTFLLLEWITFGAPAKDFQSTLGEQLALTHLANRAGSYGFNEDHFIGATPQKNWPLVPQKSGSWAEFWWLYRLEPMLRRLDESCLHHLANQLAPRLEQLLPDPKGEASLLHGDLWSGNVAADESGKPVMFDPAPYYGHPEAELGMTQLFGGFTSTFYEVYAETFPMESGWKERVDLYMLYHVLNHACLFGGSYITQAERILKRYI